MQRIIDYFRNASGCESTKRGIGIEIETLFIDKERKPITLKMSQQIFISLIGSNDWKLVESKNGIIVQIEYKGFKSNFVDYKYNLVYELGWNNIELRTAVENINNYELLFINTKTILNQIYSFAKEIGAFALYEPYDGQRSIKTLIMPDKRDEIWLELDGSVLKVLGHIAAVQYTIDLCSIDEGIEFIKLLNKFYIKKQWPSGSVSRIWKNYIKYSKADFETNRFGPPPESFKDYCEGMAGLKVFMNRQGNADLEIINYPVEFKNIDKIDFDLFLRSVWWWSRFRVINNRLALEIRPAPRGADTEIQSNFLEIKKLLKI